MGIMIKRSVDTPKGRLFETKVRGKVIRVVVTWHAIDGADDYNISVNELLNFLIFPEEVIGGRTNRFIAHKRLNRHLVRVIYEYENETVVVITFYISHINRYFRGGIYEDKILS